MRLVVLLGGLIGGVASIALLVASAPVTGDPTGTGLVDPPSPFNPAGYLTGVLLLVGGLAIFWYPILATVTLGLAAAMGVALGILGDSQDQLMFGILALFLAVTAVVIVLREGKSQEPIVDTD
jgi:hypothetical protein